MTLLRPAPAAGIDAAEAVGLPLGDNQLKLGSI